MRKSKDTPTRRRSVSHGGERAPHLMAVISDPIVARDWVEPKRCETKHNSLCEICRKFFPNHKGSTMYCIYCNVMCHVTCMTNFQKNLVPSKEWICFYCIDYLDESKQRHKQKQSDNLNLTKFTNAQIVISKYWRRFVDRRFYIKIYNLIVYLQVRFRVNKRKQEFHKQVQSKLRPYHLRITKCSNLNLDLTNKRAHSRLRKEGAELEPAAPEAHSLYIIITVLDFSKGHLTQTWRITTDLVSVDHHVHHTAAAAAPTGTTGQDTDSQPSLHLPQLVPPPAHLGSPGTHPHARPHHTHHPHHPHHAPKHVHFDCGFLLGGVSGYQFVVLSVFQRGSFSRDLMLGQAYVDLSAGMVWKRGGSFVKSLETQDFAVKDHMGMDIKSDCKPHPEGTIEFELHPVQGLCSGCGLIYAPCAEDLVRTVSLQGRFSGFTVPKPTGGALERRKYAVGSSSSGYSNMAALHTKKSWVAIADGKIYMYSHFGDSLKIRINVEHFSFYATVRNRTVVYILRSPDFPDLEFYTSNKEEELRWKCAFLSTFRYKQSGTMSVSGADTYDMRSLIRDLALVEVNRYSGKDSQMLHFYTPVSNSGGGTISNKFTSPAPKPVSSSNNSTEKVASGGKGKNGNYNNNNSSPVRRTDSTVSSPVEANLVPRTSLLHAPSVTSMTSMPSSSSLTSNSSSSVGDSSVGYGAGAHASRYPPGKLTAKPSGGGSVHSSASNAHNTMKRGVFAEIDQEIAHIQKIKAQHKHEIREHREHRRKRAVAVADIEGADSSSESFLHKPVTLQAVRDQVNDIYEVEEGILNDKINTVGASFVARIITAMKQKKMH